MQNGDAISKSIASINRHGLPDDFQDIKPLLVRQRGAFFMVA